MRASTTAGILGSTFCTDASRILDINASIMLGMTKRQSFQPIGAVLRRIAWRLAAERIQTRATPVDRNESGVVIEEKGRALGSTESERTAKFPILQEDGGRGSGEGGPTVSGGKPPARAAANAGGIHLGEEGSTLEIVIAKAASNSPCHGRPSVDGPIIGPTPHVGPSFAFHSAIHRALV